MGKLRLEKKIWLKVTNSLAYFNTKLLATVKRFRVTVV